MKSATRTTNAYAYNNHYNDDGVLTAEPADNDARSVTNTSRQEIADESDEAEATPVPEVAAAQSLAAVASNDASSGGGSANGGLVLLLLSLVGLRRCRATSRQ